MNVSVAGIPKTIDNDIDHIDHTFGFASAVEAAQVAIRSAKTEAVCNLPNGTTIALRQCLDALHCLKSMVVANICSSPLI